MTNSLYLYPQAIARDGDSVTGKVLRKTAFRVSPWEYNTRDERFKKEITVMPACGDCALKKISVPHKRYPSLGACGLDCGLCPRYYTLGKSRCPGCAGPGFADKHPTCSFITCCVKKKSLEVCGQCAEFPCPKFRNAEDYRATESSSYPPARKILPNLHFIKTHGVARFIEQQRRRINLLESMLGGFDEGRSRSFYCRAAALLGPRSLEGALRAARREIGFASKDAKARAKFLRALLNERAEREGIELN